MNNQSKIFDMIPSEIISNEKTVWDSRFLTDFFSRIIDIVLENEINFNLEFKKDIFQVKKYPDVVFFVFPKELQQHNLIEINDKLFSQHEILRKKVYTL